MELNEDNADLNVKINWGQDYDSAKEHLEEISNILMPLKEKGLLEFKAVLTRKCDFCGKVLKEGDKFETIGELDKCEECQRKV